MSPFAMRAIVLSRCLRSRAAAAFSTQATAAPPQRVALVQGASRGLGLEFVRQLAQRPNHLVIATCRRPDSAPQLQDLQRQFHGLHLVQLDSQSEHSIEHAASAVSNLVSNLDMLINVAGVLHNSAGLAPGR